MKITYDGPALAGKTSSLRSIATMTGASLAVLPSGEIHCEGPVHPLVPDVQGRALLQAYAGPRHRPDITRQLLDEADAVVFVADSQPAMLDATAVALARVKDAIHASGRRCPLVVQYNKRDLPTALSIPALETALGLARVPSRPTVATVGHGVADALALAIRLALEDAKQGAS